MIVKWRNAWTLKRDIFRVASRRVAGPEQVARTIKQKYILGGIAGGEGEEDCVCVFVISWVYFGGNNVARNGRRMSVNFAL